MSLSKTGSCWHQIPKAFLAHNVSNINSTVGLGVKLLQLHIAYLIYHYERDRVGLGIVHSINVKIVDLWSIKSGMNRRVHEIGIYIFSGSTANYTLQVIN